MARHSPSMIPSSRSGRNRRWNAITAFQLIADVIAESFKREQEGGVRPEGIDEIAGRARQGKAPLGQRFPRKQLAGILLAGGRDVGMADDIATTDAVAVLDPRDQRDEGGDLARRERRDSQIRDQD